MSGESELDRDAPVRLQKYLSRAGVASRREGERLIEAGRVSVDGMVTTELGTKVVPGANVVRVDGVRAELRPERWIALYKPAGYLTAREDDRGRRTVYSLIPREHHDLFHVGRLDRLSEGLVILTNAGDTAYRLLHPRYEVSRRYRVDVDAELGPAERRRLEKGVRLEDGVARAEDVEVGPGPEGRGSTVGLTLREGRKREIRRMMDALGLPVRRLLRVSFGPIELGDLEPGAWRYLNDEEVSALKERAGLPETDGHP